MRQEQPSQLQILHGHLTDIDNDISVIGTPIDQLNTLIGDVIDLLGKPKALSDDLKTIGEVLSKIQSIASDAAWLPEVGEAAGALSKVLIPIVKEPPPGGGIGETRTSLNEIDVVLTPIKNRLQEAQKPVNKVHNAIHKVEFDVQKLKNGTQKLIQRYGSQPPQNVEQCAKGLNNGIETVANDLRQARETVVKQLTGFLSPLSNIESAFHRVDGYLKTVQTIFDDLEIYTKALREVTNAVNTAASYGKKKIDHLFTWVGRHTYPNLYRKIKNKLDSANRFVNQVMGKIARFALDPITHEVDKLESEIKNEVNRVPAVEALEEEMASAEQTLEKLENEIGNTLSGECGKLLGTD